MSELACVSGVNLLADYLEGALPAGVSATLDSHVEGCPRCAAFIASYRETPRIVRHGTDVMLPAAVAASLQTWLRDR